MASHSLPVPLPRAAKTERTADTAQKHRLWAVIAVSVALLIMLSWLHLIQSLQIASTGREIQAQTEELERIKRINNELQIEIAQSQSPAVLARAAEEQGYRASQPVYVLFPQAVANPIQSGNTLQSVAASERQTWTEDEQTLWDYATRELNTLLEVEAAP